MPSQSGPGASQRTLLLDVPPGVGMDAVAGLVNESIQSTYFYEDEGYVATAGEIWGHLVTEVVEDAEVRVKSLIVESLAKLPMNYRRARYTHACVSEIVFDAEGGISAVFSECEPLAD